MLYLPGEKMPKTDNPLARFFRQPAIYIRLPSGGKTWPQGTLDYPANGELPVYPMTMIDEIMYRTPDALFNGESVVSVIQSCMPNIRDAWAIPVTDLDSILVAIRIATYGHSMDIDTQCPSCQTEHAFGLDLRTVLDKLGTADYGQGLNVGDLTIVFRPLNYRQITDNSQVQFEQQKTMQVLSDTELSDTARTEQINAMMKKIIDITVTALAQSIQQIRTQDAIVTDQEQITEFLNNCDRDVFTKIRDFAISLREASEMKPLKIKCPSCQHEYDQSFTLDMSRFFGSAS